MENYNNKCNKKFKKIKLQSSVAKESCTENEYINVCKDNLINVLKDVKMGSTAISKFVLF